MSVASGIPDRRERNLTKDSIAIRDAVLANVGHSYWLTTAQVIDLVGPHLRAVHASDPDAKKRFAVITRRAMFNRQIQLVLKALEKLGSIQCDGTMKTLKWRRR